MNDAVTIEANDHVLGPRDARLIIIEYGDFQCPYTARAHPTLSKLRGELGDELCLVYRNLPLSNLHPLAEIAAEAAEAAAAQGKFWEMHDALFEHQDRVSPDTLPALAESIELDIDRFRDEMLARRYRQRVQTDAEQAKRDGAKQTPTFFFNGERYSGDSDEESLTAAIKQALGR
jgi:protein-disulfide isomerase